MNSNKIYTINTYQQKIRTTYFTIMQMPYFKKIIEDNPEQTELDIEIDADKFFKILDAIRFPSKALSEDIYQLACNLGLMEYSENVKLNNMIEIDVGGEIISVGRDILMQITYFKSLLSEKWNNKKIFLDMNPIAFKYILNFVTNNEIIPPEFEEEVNFLGIQREQNILCSKKPDFDENLNNRMMINKKLVGSINDIEKHYVGNPQVTHHRSVHFRCTNFINSHFEHMVDKNILFGDCFSVNVPPQILLPCYFLFELHLDIKISNEIASLYNIKWIDFLEAIIFERVYIYYGNKFIKAITSEYILVDNIINNISYNHDKMNEIIIPFIFYTYELDEVTLNANCQKDALRLYIKLRPFHKLIQLMDRNNNILEINDTNLDYLKFITPEIKKIKFHVKYHAPEHCEELRLLSVSLQSYLITQKTYVKPITKTKCIIHIKDPPALMTIHLYIRNKGELFPIDNTSINYIECWVNNLLRFRLSRSVIIKLYETEKQLLRRENQLVYSFEHNPKHIHSRANRFSQYNHIISYDFGMHRKRSVVVTGGERYIVVHFDESIDMTDKELVLVCVGENILEIKSETDKTQYKIQYDFNEINESIQSNEQAPSLDKLEIEINESMQPNEPTLGLDKLVNFDNDQINESIQFNEPSELDESDNEDYEPKRLEEFNFSNGIHTIAPVNALRTFNLLF